MLGIGLPGRQAGPIAQGKADGNWSMHHGDRLSFYSV